MGAARKATAAAAVAATGWAVVQDKVPPATEILSYAILEAAAELKIKAERRLFRGSNLALGVLLMPFHVRCLSLPPLRGGRPLSDLRRLRRSC